MTKKLEKIAGAKLVYFNHISHLITVRRSGTWHGFLRTRVQESFRRAWANNLFCHLYLPQAILIVFLHYWFVPGTNRTAWAIPEAETASDISELSVAELSKLHVIKLSTASRFEETSSDAAASTTVISRDEIQKYHYRTLAEALSSALGFYFSNDRNYTYLGSRGFSRPGDYNTRMLLLLNGHRLNDGVYDEASFGSDFPLDMSLIERIEIVRGPFSSLYGSNAFFGVVNVITRSAKDVPSAEIAATAAKNDVYASRATTASTPKPGVGIIASGTGTWSSGQRLYYSQFDDPATNSGTASRATNQQQVSSAFVSAELNAFTFEFVYLNRENHVPTGVYGTVFNDSRTKTVDQKLYSGVNYEQKISDTLQLSSRVFFDSVSYQGFYPYEYPPESGFQSKLLNRDKSESQRVGAEILLSSRPTDSNTVVTGLEWTNELNLEQENFDIPEDEFNFKDSRNEYNLAAFAENHFSLFENLIFSAGLRLDYFGNYGSTVSPRVSAVHHLSDETTFKLLYGRAFRTANAYEKYYAVVDGQKANPDLGAETIESVDAVLEQKFAGQTKATLTFFNYDIDRLISQETDPETGYFVYKNTTGVHAYGVEAEFSKHWSSGAETTIGYSYSDAMGAGNALLANSPAHLVDIRGSLPVLSKPIFLSPHMSYTSTRRTISGAHTRDDILLHFSILAPKLWHDLDLQFSALNLLDRSYSDPSNGSLIQDTIEADGRTFRVTLTYHYSLEANAQ